MVVYKYALSIRHDEQRLTMPRGATILSVGEQSNRLFVWASVEPTRQTADQLFVVAWTGQPITFHCDRFLGTVLLDDGATVVHVWYQGEVP